MFLTLTRALFLDSLDNIAAMANIKMMKMETALLEHGVEFW